MTVLLMNDGRERSSEFAETTDLYVNCLGETVLGSEGEIEYIH